MVETGSLWYSVGMLKHVVHDCTVCYLTVKSCCRLFGNSFRFTVTCLVPLGNAHQVFWKNEQTFDPPESEKSQQLQIRILSWWLSLFHLSSWIDPVLNAVITLLYIHFSVPWINGGCEHSKTSATNYFFWPSKMMNGFMMYELAEGPTETFQNIPCVLSHVKSTLSIDFPHFSATLRPRLLLNVATRLSHGAWFLTWALRLASTKCTIFEFQGDDARMHWSEDPDVVLCIIIRLYLMFRRMYICVSIYII